MNSGISEHWIGYSITNARTKKKVHERSLPAIWFVISLFLMFMLRIFISSIMVHLRHVRFCFFYFQQWSVHAHSAPLDA